LIRPRSGKCAPALAGERDDAPANAIRWIGCRIATKVECANRGARYRFEAATCDLAARRAALARKGTGALGRAQYRRDGHTPSGDHHGERSPDWSGSNTVDWVG
jgi:hypothetical protein